MISGSRDGYRYFFCAKMTRKVSRKFYVALAIEHMFVV